LKLLSKHDGYRFSHVFSMAKYLAFPSLAKRAQGAACCGGSGPSCTSTVASLPFLMKSIAIWSPGSPPITTLVTSCGC